MGGQLFFRHVSYPFWLQNCPFDLMNLRITCNCILWPRPFSVRLVQIMRPKLGFFCPKLQPIHTFTLNLPYLRWKFFFIASWSIADSAKPPTRKKNCSPRSSRCLRRLLRCFTIPFRTGSNNFFMVAGPIQKYSFLTNWTSSVVQELANRLTRSGPPCSETSAVKVRGRRILVVSPS